VKLRALAALLWLASPGIAHASGAFEVEGRGCLDGAELAAAVSAWRSGAAPPPGVAVLVRELAPLGAHFRIARRGETLGERTIEAPRASCAELRAALALTLALSLDAVPADPPPRSPASPEPAPARLPEKIGPQTIAPLRLPAGFLAPRRRELAAEMALEGGAALGLVAAPAGLVQVSAGLRIGPRPGLSGLLRGGLVATPPASFALGTGEATVRLAAGRLDGCAAWERGAFGVEGCGGVAVGWLAAEGRGFDQDLDVGAPWAAGSLRLAGRASPLSWLGVIVAANGYVPFVAPTIGVLNNGAGPPADAPTPPVGLGLSLGLVTTVP